MGTVRLWFGVSLRERLAASQCLCCAMVVPFDISPSLDSEMHRSKIAVYLALAVAAACARHDNATAPVVPVGSNPKFETRTEISTGVAFHADCAVADFNGDNKVDLAVGGFEGEVQVLIGNGPVFTAGQLLNPGGVVIWMDHSDFDADGDVDLVILRRDVQFVEVLENDGNAQFSPGPSFPIGSGSLQVLAADATDDGIVDLLVSRPYSPEIQVFVGDGAGSFAQGQAITLPDGGQSFTMALGDATRDQIADLVVADPTLNRVLVFAGLGSNQSFSPAPTILAVPGGPAACSVGDITGDGAADIAVSCYEENRFTVITSFVAQTGTQSYTAENVAAEGRASLTTIGDVTGDGRADLVACVVDRASVLVVPQAAAGGLGQPFQMDSTGLPLRPAVVDVDLNGKNDLVVLSGLADRMNLWLSDASGKLLGARNWDSGLIESGIAVSVDLDGDGRPEVIAGDAHESRLVVMSANENLSLVPTQTIEIGSPVTQVRVADIDRDLKKDLVVSVRGGVKILRNLSTSGNVSLELVPGLSLQFGNADAPIGSAASDFNRDGFVDLAIAGYESGNVQLLLGTSNAFDYSAAPQLIQVGGGPVDVVAADFNGDKIVDLAVSRRLQSDIVVLQNDGNGTFTQTLSFPVGAAPNYLLSEDFNRDGRVDLAVANEEADSVSVLFGAAQGFTSASFAAGNFPSALLTEDLTGDGIPDILVASRLGEDFRVLVGDGQGGFPNVFGFPGTLGASGVSMGDLDGDGDRELVIGSVVTNRVSVVKSLQQNN
ncbi:MAG: hypothetical protein RLZZ562_2187 [Planctomycetota bacterium]